MKLPKSLAHGAARAALCAAAIAVALSSAGCAGTTAPTAAPEGGSGMGMGGDAGGFQQGGVVAASRDATIAVDSAQAGTRGVLVRSVTAPADGWVVVRSVAASGAVLGAKWVPAGVSRDVLVKVTAADAVEARVALHVDRGTPRVLDFDPASPLPQRDAPMFADDRAVSRRITMQRFGVDVSANSALLMVEDQRLDGGALVIRYLLVPAASWVSVDVAEHGVAGRRLGFLERTAGEWQEVRVPLSDVDGARQVVVTVHQDSGVAGRFEFASDDPLGSQDAPYRSAGIIVSQRVSLR